MSKSSSKPGPLTKTKSSSTPSYNPQLDDILSHVAQQHSGLEDFLGGIFSFFERRTDLFHVMQDKSDPMGFPPNVAQQMVVKQFEKYQDIYLKRTGNQVPEGIKRDEKGVPVLKQQQPSETAMTAATAASNKGGENKENVDLNGSESNNNQQQNHNTVNQKVEIEKNKDLNQTMKHISTWNGGVTDNYRWSQSISEVTIEVVVASESEDGKGPGLIKKMSQELDIQLTKHSLKIVCRGNLILDEKFTQDINPIESIYTLEDKSRVVFSLEKIKHTWWDSAFKGSHNQKIDTTKIESVKKVEDYNPETQGAIRKIVFDQNQKHLGLPSSDQIKTANLMKDAWNAEGSPFKGTEFDPSKLNLTNGIPEGATWNK